MVPAASRVCQTLLCACREALQQFSPRQLRLMFIMSPWNKTISYGETMRAEMRARESALKNFFQNVEVAIREGSKEEASTSAKWQVGQGPCAKTYCQFVNSYKVPGKHGDVARYTSQGRAVQVCHRNKLEAVPGPDMPSMPAAQLLIGVISILSPTECY